MKPTKPKVVKKVWGQEEIIANEPTYCGKRMTLKSGSKSSLHRHLVKDETFFVESGSMIIEMGSDPKNLSRHFLKHGDVVRIPPRTWHRFGYGVSAFYAGRNEEDCIFFEFSTHHDDSDVERLEPSGKL